MSFQRAGFVFGLIGLSLAAPAEARQTNPCGNPPCPTTGQNLPTTIIPSDAQQFQRLGDLFQDRGVELNFGTNNFVRVALGFNVDFGAGATDVAYISKDGLLSFGAPLLAFQQTDRLQNLNLPVIAPYYAKLAPAANDGAPGIGDVVLQTGFADVYPDGGAYSMNDLLPAVRISWYGVVPDSGPAAAAPPPIYTQMILAASRDGSYSTFQFRYGTDSSPGENGAGSIAGFSLYGTTLQFGGPYTGQLPRFFEFSGGSFIGQGATTGGAVPEPSVWVQMILGFAAIGYALRRRRNGAFRAPARQAVVRM